MQNKNRVKVLISIDWFLPGTNSGGPVRSYANLIAHLKDDFEFFVVTRNTDFGSKIPYENIQHNAWTIFNEYTKVYYISEDRLNKAHLKKIFEETSFDIAYINGMYSWYFSILPVILLKKKRLPVLVSARGMLNPQAFSVKGSKKKIFLKLSKKTRLYKNVQFHATNNDEAQHIKNILGTEKMVHVAPNLPRKITQSTSLKIGKQFPTRFINVARISIEKGTLIMLESLQYIDKPVIIDLYGPIYDEPYWEKCTNVINQLPENIKVTYNGVLESEKIPDTLRSYDYLILLSEGENFGHAIIEALTAGLPVLISNKTPWQDLTVKSIGWDVDITNQKAVVNSITNAITMTNEQYTAWSQAAYDFAKKFIENPDVLQQNKDLFLKTLNN